MPAPEHDDFQEGEAMTVTDGISALDDIRQRLVAEYMTQVECRNFNDAVQTVIALCQLDFIERTNRMLEADEIKRAGGMKQ